MTTSTGQYTPVFLPGEPPLPDGEAWHAIVYRVTKSWTRPKRPCAHICKNFFACGISAPVRVEHEGGAAAWLVGTLAVSSVQGHGLPPFQELWPYQSLFSSWYSEGLFSQSFSEAPPIQALRGLPCLGSFSVVRCIRHIEGRPWLGSYSVVSCIIHLKEHPGWVLLCSSV